MQIEFSIEPNSYNPPFYLTQIYHSVSRSPLHVERIQLQHRSFHSDIFIHVNFAPLMLLN